MVWASWLVATCTNGAFNQAAGRIKLAWFLLHVARYVPLMVYAADPEWGAAAVENHRQLIAALRRRDRSGRGEHVQVSLLDSALSGLVNVAQNVLSLVNLAKEQSEAGKVKALAVMSPKRTPELPDVPTLAEAGLPGVEMTTWYGLFVTGGTPDATTKTLIDELKRILALPDVQKRISDLGGMQIPLYGDDFKAFNSREFATYRTLIKDANITAQ